MNAKSIILQKILVNNAKPDISWELTDQIALLSPTESSDVLLLDPKPLAKLANKDST